MSTFSKLRLRAASVPPMPGSKRGIPMLSCVYLRDRVTGEAVEIVSEDLEVKAEPVKEKTRGNQ
jgi:hypothetical protein